MRQTFFIAIAALSATPHGMPAQPLYSVERSVPLSYDSTRKAPPKYSNGHFLVWASSDTLVLVLDSNGSLERTIQIQIPESVRTHIRDVSIAVSGEVAVAFSAESSIAQTVSGVALYTSDGSLRRIIVTSPFVAQRLVLTGSGKVWAAGYELDEQKRERADYFVVHVYDEDGKLTRKELRRASLGEPRMPAVESFIAASGGKIALLLTGSKRYFEFDEATGVADVWVFESLPGKEVTGLTLMQGARTFISLQRPVHPAERDRATGPDIMSLHELNKSSNSLDRVDVSSIQGRLQGVLVVGSDGGRLLVRTKPPNVAHWLNIR